jgi:sulfur carrier protein
MQITLNGEPYEITSGDSASLLRLLELKKVQSPDMVAVQINGTVLARQRFEETQVQPGDVVEFLYFMGGGAT